MARSRAMVSRFALSLLFALLAVLCLLPTRSLAAALASPAVPKADLERAAETPLADVVTDYRWFHRHPELSGKEEQTAAHVATALRTLGMDVHEGIGGHGIVATMTGATSTGPVVLYRADMDGLPVLEDTGLPYASENIGVMHACGHDVHMATAIGVMRALKELSAQWNGTVLFVGQPAEETGSGARAMLGDPRFAEILAKVGKPTVALALHDAADLAAGDVSLIPGFHYANVDTVDVVIHGKGGHGAQPHETIDPIVIGAEVVMSLQTIVSRRLRPGEPAVVTVGSFVAGAKHNIIPPNATLLLTVRSYSDETRKFLLAEIERITRQIAKAHRAPKAPEVKVGREALPSAYNDPAWTEKIRATFVGVLGAEHVREHRPSMGGEDFGLFARELKIPGVMWKLGGVDAKRWKASGAASLPGLHSDHWAPAPEPTLRAGIRTGTAAVLQALGAL